MSNFQNCKGIHCSICFPLTELDAARISLEIEIWIISIGVKTINKAFYIQDDISVD